MTNSTSVLSPLQETLRRRSLLIGFALAAGGAVLFSTKAIVIKLAYAAGADAETMQALRMVIALPIYVVIGLHTFLPVKHEGEWKGCGTVLLRAASIGLLGYWVSSYLDLKGLEYISAQLERLILFTYPFFVVLFGALLFGQAVGKRSILAFAVSYIGLGIAFVPGSSTGAEPLIGAALVLLASMTFAIYQLLAKSAVGAMGVRLFTCVAMTAAAIAALIQFAIAHGLSSIELSPDVLMLGFVLAIAGTVLPSFLLNAALQRISAQANATIGAVSPIVTIVLAVVILGEPLTAAGLLGGLLVILGVGWFTILEQRRA